MKKQISQSTIKPVSILRVHGYIVVSLFFLALVVGLIYLAFWSVNKLMVDMNDTPVEVNQSLDKVSLINDKNKPNVAVIDYKAKQKPSASGQHKVREQLVHASAYHVSDMQFSNKENAIDNYEVKVSKQLEKTVSTTKGTVNNHKPIEDSETLDVQHEPATEIIDDLVLSGEQNDQGTAVGALNLQLDFSNEALIIELIKEHGMVVYGRQEPNTGKRSFDFVLLMEDADLSKAKVRVISEVTTNLRQLSQRQFPLQGKLASQLKMLFMTQQRNRSVNYRPYFQFSPSFDRRLLALQEKNGVNSVAVTLEKGQVQLLPKKI